MEFTLREIDSRTLRHLRNARALLARPKGWIKGRATVVRPNGFIQFCMIGAINHVTMDDDQRQQVQRAILCEFGGRYSDIPHFNDALHRRKPEVLGVFDSAIAKFKLKLDAQQRESYNERRREQRAIAREERKAELRRQHRRRLYRIRMIKREALKPLPPEEVAEHQRELVDAGE